MPKIAPDWLDIAERRQEDCFNQLRDDNFRSFVAKCQNKYWHWDRVRMLAHHRGIDPELAWWWIASERHGQFKTLPQLRDAKGKPLRFINTDKVSRESMVIDQRLAGQITFAGGTLSEAEGRGAIQSSLQEEAITSSMLEGAATTRREAKAMLESKRPPKNRGEQMVLNNWNAIEMVRDHHKTPLTPQFLIELQEMLTHDTLDRPDEVGRLRTETDRIVVEDQCTGDVIHTPPPASELPERLAALCEIANQSHADLSDFVHPVVRAIALHFQIGYDHPFCDGNGRTARTIFYWSMLNQGYWLFEYLPISRLIYAGPAKYIAAFLYTETDHADLTYFLQYHLHIIRRAADDFELHIQRKRQEAEALSQKQRPLRLLDRQWHVLKWMRDNPAEPVDVQMYQQRTRVSYGTARTDLKDLEARRLIRKVKISRKFVYFVQSAKR